MRNYLFPAFLFFILLTIYSLNIPFFWDAPVFSEMAVNFYSNGFNGFIAPAEIDQAGFPLYSVYLATVWRFFGKTLAVSHIAMLPFLLGIAYEYWKLAKQFLTERILPFAMILLLIEPTFITQGILMGYDVVMIYFFFFSLNALLENKQAHYRIGLLLLCLCNMRGIMLGISLLLLDVSISYSVSGKIIFKWKNYIAAVVTIAIWAIHHQQQTGWYFFSPTRENTDESFVPAMIARRLLFIGWKIADFGRITLLIFLIVMGVFFYKKNKTDKLNLLLKIIFIPLIILTIFISPLGVGVGHKYFIVVFLCVNIGVCYLLQTINNKNLKINLCVIFCISLINGNFWLYPEKYGNGWDSSLKVLPYFKLKKEMDAFIYENKIPPNNVGTQFPLIADKKYTDLSDSTFHYPNVARGPLNNYAYFLQTNVINTDIPDQFEAAKKSWTLIKHLESGQVYISLYKNNDPDKLQGRF